MWRFRAPLSIRFRLVLLAGLVALGGAGPVAAQSSGGLAVPSAGAAQAPFGDQVSERIPFYNRMAPQVATSAPLDRLGIIEAKGVGFRSIVDLQSARQASSAERRMAEFALLQYHNLPIAGALPTDAEVAAFARLIEAPENQPILVHGSSLDQAAAMWALYRAAKGVPPEVALGDGMTAGLVESEAALRERLQLPATANEAGRDPS